MLGYIRLHKKFNITENAIFEQSVNTSHPSSRWSALAICFLTFTNALFGAQLFYTWSRSEPIFGNASVSGYRTEWRPAVESIKLEETTFTSPLYYNTTSRQLYREFDPAQPKYIGPPSAEIDVAWEELLYGQFLVLNDDEAAELDNPISVEGQWLGEVEVMHSLHCLNALRKALSPEYYGPMKWHTRQSVHLEHCFEQVRQSIQCAGDLTPVVLRPANEGFLVLGTPMVHTCRSWDAIRTWYTERGEKHGTAGY